MQGIYRRSHVVFVKKGLDLHFFLLPVFFLVESTLRFEYLDVKKNKKSLLVPKKKTQERTKGHYSMMLDVQVKSIHIIVAQGGD